MGVSFLLSDKIYLPGQNHEEGVFRSTDPAMWGILTSLIIKFLRRYILGIYSDVVLHRETLPLKNENLG
jgi:hypothetical protein